MTSPGSPRTRSCAAARCRPHSRESMAEQLRSGDPAPIAQHLPAALETLAGLRGQPAELAAEARWLTGTVEGFVRTQHPLSDVDAARMLAGIQHTELRDAAWCVMDRTDAASHVALWNYLTRRAPEQVKTPAAALLAFSAWLGGDGARAWVALDQIPDPSQHTLALLVGQALIHGVPPPTSWTPPSGGPDVTAAGDSPGVDRPTGPSRQMRGP